MRGNTLIELLEKSNAIWRSYMMYKETMGFVKGIGRGHCGQCRSGSAGQPDDEEQPPSAAATRTAPCMQVGHAMQNVEHMFKA